MSIEAGLEMMLPSNNMPVRRPVVLNAGALRAQLVAKLGDEAWRLRGVDAILVRVRVDGAGSPIHARAISPRLAGAFLSPLPALFDERGNKATNVVWCSDARVLRAASEVALAAEFDPAVRGGARIAASSTIVIRLTSRVGASEQSEREAMSISIEPMQPEHWSAVAAIYEQGIATGDATFETAVPSWEAWDEGHLAAGRLVAVVDGVVAGWAALSPVSRRSAYAGVAEVSVYVSADHRGTGIGSRLLDALIDAAESAGTWTLQAAVFPENETTLRLHARHGFREVGRRERIGKLAGRWRDTVLLERRSGGDGSATDAVPTELARPARAPTHLEPERTTIVQHPVSLPFTIKRGDDVIEGVSVTTTKETVHGLLRLEPDRLTIQWRRFMRTERVGVSIRTDKEVEAVKSVTVPIGAISSGKVRPGRWWWSKPKLVLTAADLRAFEGIAGESGLRLDHPAELILPLARNDRLRAEEFAAELTLAIVEAGGEPRIEESDAQRIGQRGAGRELLGGG